MSILNKIFPTEKSYKVTTKRYGHQIGEAQVSTKNKAFSFFPRPLTEEEDRRFENKGQISMQVGKDVITIESDDVSNPPEKIYEHMLIEKRMRHDDPEMQMYHQDRHDNRRAREVEKEQMASAPYAVGWSGQSMEWYGSDDPSTGKGRYKSKGDGGRVVAINVPSYQEAERVEQEIEEKYRNGTLDPHVDASRGDDHYMVHYHGPWIKSMKDLDEYDKVHLKYDNPEDYGAQQ